MQSPSIFLFVFYPAAFFVFCKDLAKRGFNQGGFLNFSSATHYSAFWGMCQEVRKGERG